MSEFLLQISYLVGSITFIIGLKRLSSPEKARSGNIIASVGMLVAIIATILFHKIGEGDSIDIEIGEVRHTTDGSVEFDVIESVIDSSGTILDQVTQTLRARFESNTYFNECESSHYTLYINLVKITLLNPISEI